MTDPGPFVPPSGALPPRPADAGVPPIPTPPSSSPPVLPPPTGSPIGSAAPTGALPPVAPPPPPRRPWLIPVVIVASLVAVAVIAGVVVVAVQLGSMYSQSPVAGQSPDDVYLEPDDLLEGDPGSPVAADPLTCAVCFGLADARDLGLDDEVYENLGLPVGDESSYEIPAGKEQTAQTTWWTDDGGTPDACYFTYPQAPLYFAPGDSGDDVADRDTIYYPEWHSDVDEYYFFTEGVRVFADTAAATAYLAQLETAIDGCSNFSFPDSGWSVSVSAAPALDLPASVAGYGWAESGGFTRFYAIDLQRGNLVVRLTLSSDAYGPSETDFRAAVEEYATVLAALEPTL